MHASVHPDRELRVRRRHPRQEADHGTSTCHLTDANEVTIDGLRNNDWENNEAVPGWYRLVGDQGPRRFELQTRPIAFQVLQTNLPLDNEYTATTVKDVPTNGGFNLPLTGAAGVGVLIGAGALVAAPVRPRWPTSAARSRPTPDPR